MKKQLIGIWIGLFLCGVLLPLQAQDLLPSEIYYNNNIAINDINANSPSNRDDGIRPPGGGDGSGGDGGWVGSEDAPIGDATLPFVVAGCLYGAFLLYRNKAKKLS